MAKSLLRVDLRRLILWMCLFFVFLALGNSLYAAYKVQHALLLQSGLDANRAYAEKLAHLTDSFLTSSKELLYASALDVSFADMNPVAAQEELEQISVVTDAFDSLIVVNESGIVIAASPQSQGLLGSSLKSPQARQLLHARHATAVSRPYKAATGRWIVLIAHPAFKLDGSYGGFVGGSLYLHEANALQDVLGKSGRNDGSSLYVVDDTGSLIYHPEPERIGSAQSHIPAVQAVLSGRQGAMHDEDGQATEQLVGFAPITSTGWGIVVQNPAAGAVANIETLFWRTFFHSLPLFVLSLMAIWWLAKWIARPLQDLAFVAANLDNRDNFSKIRFIKDWYYEATLIRKGLMRGSSAVSTRMRELRRQGATDPLTELMNRRGLDAALAELAQTETQLAVVALDVDHFKDVNDTYGHAAGDDVLKKLASLALSQARSLDIVARSGGEEFMVVLPGATLDAAKQFAERLRLSIAQSPFDIGRPITVSLGVAHYPRHGKSIDAVLEAADSALYAAKAGGRNCVRLASS